MEQPGKVNIDLLKAIDDFRRSYWKFKETVGGMDKNAITAEKENLEKFNDKFNNIDNALINPIVLTINKKIAEEGFSLNSITNLKNHLHEDRKFVQIVLHEKEKPYNLLSDPYLLIEGYPKSGKVRISHSGATDEGELVPIDTLNKDILQSSLGSFLRNKASR